MADGRSFQDLQRAFAAHIRDPDNAPAPSGIEDRRMAIYRDLMFNNLLKLLGGTFPVLRRIHTDEHWRHMVRRFMAAHRAQTPYFLEIPKEFLGFLESEYEVGDKDFPFLLELAHYEWAELALSVSEASNDDLEVDSRGALLDGIPVKSRLAWQLSYRYPVHRINTDFLPAEPGPQATSLVLVRRRDDEVGFMELNAVTARLLDAITANERASGRELLESLASEIDYPDTGAFVRHGASAMQEMHDAEILLGTRRSA